MKSIKKLVTALSILSLTSCLPKEVPNQVNLDKKEPLNFNIKTVSENFCNLYNGMNVYDPKNNYKGCGLVNVESEQECINLNGIPLVNERPPFIIFSENDDDSIFCEALIFVDDEESCLKTNGSAIWDIDNSSNFIGCQNTIISDEESCLSNNAIPFHNSDGSYAGCQRPYTETNNPNTNLSPNPVDDFIQTEELNVIKRKDFPEINDFEVKLRVGFNPKRKDINKIKIPESGDFKIVFQKGSEFKIADNDATDGEAIIKVPQGIFSTYAKVQNSQELDPNAKIYYQDHLYHIKDNLMRITDMKEKWYDLKSRPFPIPNNWNNPSTKKVHNFYFKNNGVKGVKLAFSKSDEVDYPLGSNLIGPEGGIVEIPGVAKLEIPSGAINNPKMISMTQRTVKPEIKDSTNEEDLFFDYVSPLISIEPNDLKLKNAGKLYLEVTNKERIGNNDFRMSDYIKVGNFHQFSKSNTISENEKTFALVDKLGLVARVLDRNITPYDGYQVETFDNNGTFSISSTNPSKISIDWSKKRSDTEIDPLIKAEILTRVFASINFFQNFSGIDIGRAKVKFSYKEDASPTTSGLVDTITLLGYAPLEGIEHEVWHLFQNNFYGTYTNTFPDWSGTRWIRESEAELMGAYAFKNATEVISSNSQIKNDYISRVEQGSDSLWDSDIRYGQYQTFPYYSGRGRRSDYLGVTYLTYLTHPQIKWSKIKKLHTGDHPKKFHDFAESVFLNKKIHHIYEIMDKKYHKSPYYDLPIRKQIPQKDDFPLLIEPRKDGFKPNNSIEGYLIDFKNVSKVRNYSLFVRYNQITPSNNSSCGNLKMKLYTYKNGVEKAKNYEDVYNIYNPSTKVDGYINQDFDFATLMITSSTGKIEENNCYYQIELDISPPVPFPVNKSNIVIPFNGTDTKVSTSINYYSNDLGLLDFSRYANSIGFSTKSIDTLTIPKMVRSIDYIGQSFTGDIVGPQPGKDYTKSGCGDDGTETRTVPTTRTVSRLNITGLNFSTDSPLEIGQSFNSTLRGSYYGMEKPSYVDSDCPNWSSSGYNRCYYVGNLSGQATISYSSEDTLSITANISGNGKEITGGFYPCDEGIVKNATEYADFPVNQTVSFELPVSVLFGDNYSTSPVEP